MTVLTRIVAFTPLVVLSLLTGLAAVAGLTAADDASAFPAARSDGAAVTAVPFDPEPALDRLATDTARYENLVTIGPHMVREIGSFDIRRQAFQAAKIADGPDGKYVIYLRHLGDGTNFVQMIGNGEAPGCWGKFSDEELSTQTTDLLGEPSQQVPAPAPVTSLLQIEYEGATRIGRTVSADIDAYFGLTLLGLNSARILLPIADELDGHLIPVELGLDSESDEANIISAAVDGDQALAALDGVDLGSEVEQALALVDHAFTIRATGQPVVVKAPPAESLIPAGEEAWDSCPAAGR